jgi:hypothetical protein
MIWYQNLELNKKSLIPYSIDKKKFFRFEKIWEYSIIIRFDLDEIDIENLYCVINSYLWNKDLRVTKIYSGCLTQEKKKILSYSNIFIVKKMNLIFFNEWIENIINHDKLYLIEEDKEFFGIIICFSKDSLNNYLEKNNLDKNEIVYIKPIYPWNNSILTHLNYYK